MNDVKDILDDIVSTAEAAHATRSCVNCAHAQKSFKESIFWKCMRFGGTYCEEAVKDQRLCGLPLKYWAPKPPKEPGFWARLFGTSQSAKGDVSER
jgi:hypothetical protein